MAFDLDITLSDIDKLIAHVDDCIQSNDGNSGDFIKARYLNIQNNTPFSWYISSGLEWDIVSSTYASIMSSLLTLKARMEHMKEQKCFSISAFFNEIEPRIIKEIKLSEQTIKIAIAWISSENVLKALEEQAKKGVLIQVVLYQCESNKKAIARIQQMANCFVFPFPPYGNGYENIMHNKFAVFDYERIITGSYNWSSHAKYNFENIVIIYDGDLGRQFTAHFNELLKHCKDNRVT